MLYIHLQSSRPRNFTTLKFGISSLGMQTLRLVRSYQLKMFIECLLQTASITSLNYLLWKCWNLVKYLTEVCSDDVMAAFTGPQAMY